MGTTFQLTHSVKMCALLVTAVLVLPLLASAVSAEEESYIRFYENFEGTDVDTQKWAVQENTNLSGYPSLGGSIGVNDSCIWLSSDGSVFPWINTVTNPFPASGDFAVTWSLTYTCIADWGDGFVISCGPHDDPANPYKDRVLTLWAHDEGETRGVILIELLGQRVFTIDVPGFRPASDAHLYRLEYRQGNYTIYVDNKAVASAQSQIRPDSIGIGHPPVQTLPNSPESTQRWAYWGWTSSKTDFVRVEALGGDYDWLYPTEITLSTSTETQEIGYRIDITGTLASNGEPIPDAQVLLFYDIPGISEWNGITSVTTNSAGVYSASWIPTATGLFTLRASYVGPEFRDASVAKNISILQITGKDVFFVESNSTLSSLAFNSTLGEISFTVSGSSGTSGFVKFSVSKSLIPEPTALKVFLDGRQLTYAVDSVGETWLLNFEYTHSIHTVVISTLQSAKADNSTLITAIIVSLVLAAPVGLIVLFTKRRKTKT